MTVTEGIGGFALPVITVIMHAKSITMAVSTITATMSTTIITVFGRIHLMRENDRKDSAFSAKGKGVVFPPC